MDLTDLLVLHFAGLAMRVTDKSSRGEVTGSGFPRGCVLRLYQARDLSEKPKLAPSIGVSS